MTILACATPFHLLDLLPMLGMLPFVGVYLRSLARSKS
jgi:hypothetical protein